MSLASSRDRKEARQPLGLDRSEGRGGWYGMSLGDGQVLTPRGLSLIFLKCRLGC